MLGFVLTKFPLATLFKRLPTLKIAVPIKDIEYSPLHRDVGIGKLPVTW
jgi:fungal nitric oxide reductase